VVLFDPAGLWQSGSADKYDFHRWTSDLNAVIQVLPHRNITLWGTTLGAWPVLETGRQPDKRITHLVIEWPVLFFSEGGQFASVAEKGEGYRHAEELRAPSVDYFMEMERVYEKVYGTETMLRFAKRLAGECNKPGAAVCPYFKALVEVDPNPYAHPCSVPLAISYSDPMHWGEVRPIPVFAEKTEAGLLLKRPLAPWDDDKESFQMMRSFLEKD
jgi:hypothetical protein